MIELVRNNARIVPLVICFLFLPLQFSKKWKGFPNVHLFSFLLGIMLNGMLEIKIDDRKYVDWVMQRVLSYSLCISLMMTFSCMKKKAIVCNQREGEERETTFTEEGIKKKKYLYNLLIGTTRVAPFGIAFMFGAIGTLVGGMASYQITKRFFLQNNEKRSEERLKKYTSCFVATYIGGYINFVEVADLLAMDILEKNSMFVLDDLFTNLFLITLPLWKHVGVFFFLQGEKSEPLHTSECATEQNGSAIKLSDEQREAKNREEITHLLWDSPPYASYGSFLNDEDWTLPLGEDQKIKHHEVYFLPTLLCKCLSDCLSVVLIIGLSTKVLSDYEFIYQFVTFYTPAEKFKTYILFSLAFGYLFCLDCIANIMTRRIKRRTQRAEAFITHIYFRATEYYSTVLHLLTVYYLSLSGMSIDVSVLCNTVKPLTILVVCLLTTHLICVFLFSYMFNVVTKWSRLVLHVDEVLLAINANIGGPSTAALMSDVLSRPDLAFAATFWGVFGYFVATHAAMGMYALL
ncbi:conserved Plasmodium protein, unknown function [Plasmodium knowlesi strain H]|uniref:Uncharacterized protein n=3 Tax=Plasmodium knowlesi TaxID=5850 RepID=A0A5K1USA0_PLAKH|nr:conserved protein, unknown function [Plasmodium knowlesi strain H]OTN66205.1 Uncharacterized protein PKNOH_S09530400 [Plasmodium knowlesi]CAA9990003.1 conserved protein, unknown function [Plasmodium knowlesi strain H]SBO24600.1 conserved Plasmodium protein, unknown function [Plasmodium knowlesi strain H]SBO26242.1 conserved Plasmodium protein, unknown function [Plasmodium knowlesi strain H]VVS79477.1 conserved protein, unknown function [Plasmodium knowlesi strain H]|eukprot:XP_002260018.1 hypothetical protein, conserved in Plasmodium species [Plasmodium knowlesi strain H]